MKKRDECIFRYLIQLKGEAIGTLTTNDLKEVGFFEVFGINGTGFQGYTDLKEIEFREYICMKFSISPDLIIIINPAQYIGI